MCVPAPLKTIVHQQIKIMLLFTDLFKPVGFLGDRKKDLLNVTTVFVLAMKVNNILFYCIEIIIIIFIFIYNILFCMP